MAVAASGHLPGPSGPGLAGGARRLPRRSPHQGGLARPGLPAHPGPGARLPVRRAQRRPGGGAGEGHRGPGALLCPIRPGHGPHRNRPPGHPDRGPASGLAVGPGPSAHGTPDPVLHDPDRQGGRGPQPAPVAGAGTHERPVPRRDPGAADPQALQRQPPGDRRHRAGLGGLSAQHHASPAGRLPVLGGDRVHRQPEHRHRGRVHRLPALSARSAPAGSPRGAGDRLLHGLLRAAPGPGVLSAPAQPGDPLPRAHGGHRRGGASCAGSSIPRSPGAARAQGPCPAGHACTCAWRGSTSPTPQGARPSEA